jgi:hypothetical protein
MNMLHNSRPKHKSQTKSSTYKRMTSELVFMRIRMCTHVWSVCMHVCYADMYARMYVCIYVSMYIFHPNSCNFVLIP